MHHLNLQFLFIWVAFCNFPLKRRKWHICKTKYLNKLYSLDYKRITLSSCENDHRTEVLTRNLFSIIFLKKYQRLYFLTGWHPERRSTWKGELSQLVIHANHLAASAPGILQASCGTHFESTGLLTIGEGGNQVWVSYMPCESGHISELGFGPHKQFSSYSDNRNWLGRLGSWGSVSVCLLNACHI